MKQSFLKHFMTIGLGTFVSMFIGFLTTPIITRLVDPYQYGQYSIFTLYGSIMLMVFCLGLDQALVRFYYDKDTLEYKRGLLYKCLPTAIAATLFGLLIITVLIKLNVIKFELGESIFALLGIYTIGLVIYRFSQLLVRLQYRTKLFSALNVIQKVVYVAFTLIALRVTSWSDELVLMLGTTLAVIVCIFTSIFAERDTWNFLKIKKNDCYHGYKELLKYAYPYVFSMGLSTLFQALDKLSLNMYGTYADVGIYTSTMTLVNIFAIIQTSFNSLWSPMAVEHYTKHPDDKTFYKKGNLAITVVMYFIGITLILAKDVFAILLGEKYRQAAYILPFLIFNPIMYTISETTVNGLVFMKKSKMQVLVSFVACLTNLTGNTLLVPKLGCQGAAISTGISYIIFFTMRTMLSNKYFYVDFSLKKFYSLTVVVVFYAFYNTFIPFNLGSVIGYLICLIALIALYKDTIIWEISYVIKFIRNRKP